MRKRKTQVVEYRIPADFERKPIGLKFTPANEPQKMCVQKARFLVIVCVVIWLANKHGKYFHPV